MFLSLVPAVVLRHPDPDGDWSTMVVLFARFSPPLDYGVWRDPLNMRRHIQAAHTRVTLRHLSRCRRCRTRIQIKVR